MLSYKLIKLYQEVLFNQAIFDYIFDCVVFVSIDTSKNFKGK